MSYGRGGAWVALAVALCLSGGAQGATLHVGNSGTPETLDPHHASGIREAWIIGDLFMGLTADAADGSVIPGVAESWTISDDGLRWTFALGDHVWSDGTPVTADHSCSRCAGWSDVARRGMPALAGSGGSLHRTANAASIRVGTARAI